MNNEEAIQLRDEMEVCAGAIQAVVNKLNQFIEGEITQEEYADWVEQNGEMLDEAEF